MKRTILVFLLGTVTTLLWAQRPVNERVAMTTLQFAQKDGQALRMDVYVDSTSTAWAADSLHPVFIFSFGGSWEHGTRADGKAILEDFARHGYIGVGIDYRLGVRMAKDQGAQIAADNMGSVYAKAIAMGIEDLFDATAFVLAHAAEWGADTGRVVACGSSAGAINTLTAEYLLCNSHPLATDRLPDDFNYAALIPLAGGVWMVDPDTLVWQRKPCPILAYHGTKDQLVPYGKQVFGPGGGFGPDYFIPQLKAMQVPYLFHSYKDSDHIIAMLHNSATARMEMLTTLQKVVNDRIRLNSTVVDEFYDLTPTLRDFFDSQDQLGMQWRMPGTDNK